MLRPWKQNTKNIIESEIKSQHSIIKPNTYLIIESMTCQGLTAEDGGTELYNKALTRFEEDPNKVYHFMIICRYEKEPPDYAAIVTAEKKNNPYMFGLFNGGRRRSRRSRKSRKNRKTRRR